MTLGTLILDQFDNYVYEDGSLPPRTTWDKDWLAFLVSKNIVTDEGRGSLPPSMIKLCNVSTCPTLAVTIPEIGALADVIIVTRVIKVDSKPFKRFRFDGFECLVKANILEVWIKED